LEKEQRTFERLESGENEWEEIEFTRWPPLSFRFPALSLASLFRFNFSFTPLLSVERYHFQSRTGLILFVVDLSLKMTTKERL
jgi:hypothetical protein